MIEEDIQVIELKDVISINTFEPNVVRFCKILREMGNLYDKKNKDYGNSFDKTLDEDGLLVLKIRLSDKLNRFSRLIQHNNEVKDESIRDTLIDLANYAAMGVKWLDNNK